MHIRTKHKITAMSRNLPNLLSEASMNEIVCRENGDKMVTRFYLFTEQKKTEL